ncbi:hypothetical protein HMPREF6745_1272 [Prevotella sp. oral taxon 472 str. F0295]|nr:hypothetical protein HMPREF6745_1272 [Prevotella sp. oral taxon 472 str. F0295]
MRRKKGLRCGIEQLLFCRLLPTFSTKNVQKAHISMLFLSVSIAFPIS